MSDESAHFDARWSAATPTDYGSADAAYELATCLLGKIGPGRVLDVGSGGGALVRALLRLGIDARGVDISPVAVRHCEQHTPGRFIAGDARRLPFGDAEFDIVVAVDTLDCLTEADVSAALAELRRVARRAVFVQVWTTFAADDRWRRTRRERAWWEEACFDAGLRKHAAYYSLNRYESLEAPTIRVTIPLEPLPDEARRAYPREWLSEERSLHMDMLRESGRRSDAHVARYALAADMVRAGDVVVDVACGMGYGTHVLRQTTRASRVVGIDSSERAVQYATECYGRDGAIDFRVGDAQDLHHLPDSSADVLVSFETLEHLPEPTRLIAEARRVLRPGGRIIVSVPNRWVDETGRDPNPFHLHVYDFDTLRSQLAEKFLIEKAYAQVAGNGFVLSDRTRRLREVSADQPPADAEAEWWLMAASVDPVEAARTPFTEVYYGYSRPPAHLLAFARDYANPWLVRTLVEYPTRAMSHAVLRDIADRTVSVSPVGSVDAGAALCVVGYRLLHDDGATAAHVQEMLARIEPHLSPACAAGHALRWRISLAYLRAALLGKLGRFDEAERAFDDCAAIDCGPFSPTLGTKTVLARFQAGWLAASRGDVRQARRAWSLAIDEARRLLACDWSEYVGDPEVPLVFPMVCAVEFLDVAVRAANALRATHPSTAAPPARLWQDSHQSWQTMIDERWRAIRRMEDMIRERDVSLGEAAKHAQLVEGSERNAQQQRRAAEALAVERLNAIHEQSRMIAERDAALAALRRDADSSAALARERLAALESQGRMVAERDAWITDLQSRLAIAETLAAERFEAMCGMDAMIRQRDEHLAAAAERARAADTQLLALQRELGEARADAEAHSAELARVRRSVSWRMTRPLRAVGQLLRSLILRTNRSDPPT